MTSRIDGQTDEQAEGDAIGSGESGLERVLGLTQRRSSPQFEDARRCSRHKRLGSPRGGVTLVREEPGGVAGRRSYGKCRFILFDGFETIRAERAVTMNPMDARGRAAASLRGSG